MDLGVAFPAHCGPRLNAVQIRPATLHVVDINAFGASYPPRMQHPARLAIGMRFQELRTQNGILPVLFGALCGHWRYASSGFWGTRSPLGWPERNEFSSMLSAFWAFQCDERVVAPRLAAMLALGRDHRKSSQKASQLAKRRGNRNMIMDWRASARLLWQWSESR